MRNRPTPNYVPSEIVREYEEYVKGCILPKGTEWSDQKDRDSWERRTHILESLIFSPTMRKVWTTLRKRGTIPPGSHHKVIVNSYPFMDAVFKGLEGGSPWQEITRANRVTEHDDLVADIKSLAKKLDKYHIRDRILCDLTDEESFNIQLQSYGISIYNEAKVSRFREENHTHSSLLFLQDHSSPSLAEALRRLNKRLEANPPYKESIPGKINGKHAKLNFFIRTVAIHNKDWYGENLRGTLADLASVFFPEIGIDKDMVKDALRNQ